VFSASNGVDPPLVVGPNLIETASFDLGVGTWTIQASLGDNLFCPPDASGDSVCSQTVVVKPLSANPNVASQGVASQSSGWNGDQFPASMAIDGNFFDFSHTSGNDPAPTWQLTFDDVFAIDAVKLTNRRDCCQSRLRDITVSILDIDGVEVFTSELLNPEDVLGGSVLNVGPDSLALNLVALTGGPVTGSEVKVARTPDDDLSGSGFAGGPEEGFILSLGEVEVFAAPAELPATAVRDIGADSFQTEATVPVTIALTTKAADTPVKVMEVLPPGTTATGITEGGQLNAGTITWDFPAVTAKTLAYDLAVDRTCAEDVKFPGSSIVAAGKKGKVRGEASITRTIQDTPLTPWESVEIGTTDGAAMRLGAHELLVLATGAGVKLKRDELRFIHQPASGDFEVSASIDCVQSAGAPQAGLMVRGGLDVDAPMLFFYFTPSADPTVKAGNLRANLRTKAANSASTISIPAADSDVSVLPIYLKLARKGTTLVGSRSADGTTWTDVVTKEIGTDPGKVALDAATLYGLAASAFAATPARITFRGISGPEFPSGTAGAQFRRGDSDGSGKLDLTDAIFSLSFLFQGGPAPGCSDAADANDDGRLDLTDPIFTLGFLFQGGDTPPAPGPTTCGPDTTPAAFPPCVYPGC
jgi:hypothetical protein